MRWFDLSRDFLKGQSWRIKLNFECSKCFLSAKIFCIFCQFLRYLCSVSACPRVPHMLTRLLSLPWNNLYLCGDLCVKDCRNQGFNSFLTERWAEFRLFLLFSSLWAGIEGVLFPGFLFWGVFCSPLQKTDIPELKTDKNVVFCNFGFPSLKSHFRLLCNWRWLNKIWCADRNTHSC